MGVFDAFQCILNVLLECTESFNTVQCILYAPIVLLESIDMILAHYAGIIYPPLCFLLCRHIYYYSTIQPYSVDDRICNY